MKKVVILVADYSMSLEDKINRFLESHTVTDIQYQMSSHAGPGNCYGTETHSAMIIYEEDT